MGKGELPVGPSHGAAVPGHLRSPGQGGRSSCEPSQALQRFPWVLSILATNALRTSSAAH